MAEKPGHRSCEAIKVTIHRADLCGSLPLMLDGPSSLSSLKLVPLKTADEVCKRSVDLPIQPDQPIGTMAVVVPPRMIEDWVETDTFDRNTAPPRLVHIITYIGEPRSPIVALDPGFCDK